MQIGTADTAGNDFEVDIVGLELFGFELEVELSEGRILKGLQDSALRTSRRLKLLHSFGSSIMKPSKVSG